MIAVICVDDTKKPSEIPYSHWVEREQSYHVTHISKMANQNNILGFTLAEIDLLSIKDCPYEVFRASRFVTNEENFLKLLELAKDCAELNDLNLDELFEEQLVLIEK